MPTKKAAQLAAIAKAKFIKDNTQSVTYFNQNTGEKTTVMHKPLNPAISKKNGAKKAQLARKVAANVSIVKSNQVVAQTPNTSFVVKATIDTIDTATKVDSIHDLIIRFGWDMSEAYTQDVKGVQFIYLVASRGTKEDRENALVTINENMEVTMLKYASVQAIKAKIRLLNFLKPAKPEQVIGACNALNIRARKGSFVQWTVAEPKPVDTKALDRPFVIVNLAGEFYTSKGGFVPELELAQRYTLKRAYAVSFEIRRKDGIACHYKHIDNLSGKSSSVIVDSPNVTHYRDNVDVDDTPISEQTGLELSAMVPVVPAYQTSLFDGLDNGVIVGESFEVAPDVTYTTDTHTEEVIITKIA